MCGDKKSVSIQVRARLCIVENSDSVRRSKLAARKLREAVAFGGVPMGWSLCTERWA